MVFQDQIQVFPNPVEQQLNIAFELQQASAIELTIFNTLGKLVLIRDFSIPSGDFQTTLDMNHLETGVYFLQFSDGEQSFSRKVIKME